MYKRERTPLYDAFFSAPNTAAIQTEIMRQTYERTGQQISQQDARPLSIIMESVFATNANNFYANLQQQISDMNNATVKESVRQTVMGIDAYKRYIRDITEYPQVNQMSDPVMVSQTGKKIPLNNKYAF